MTFALIDPNWGEPKVIAATVRTTEAAAWDAACRCDEVALYSGASDYPLPHGTMGKRENLERHGYRVAPVRVEIAKSN